jgi:sugar (pentulose or hexulose) kinase
MEQRIREFCRTTGQQVPEGQGAVVRCAYESLALKYRWAVEHLEAVTHSRVDELVIVGGGARNVLLNQLTANALKRPVVAGPSEATAIGNLLVQLHALGEVGGLDELREIVRVSFPTTRYEPEDAGRWDGAYERFLRLIV